MSQDVLSSIEITPTPNSGSHDASQRTLLPPEALDDTSIMEKLRIDIQAWMAEIHSVSDDDAIVANAGVHRDSSSTEQHAGVAQEVGRLMEILYPPASFNHIDLQLVHQSMSACRDGALFHLMAAEHRMMFFMERLEASRRELERVYLNYCRAVEVLESGLDLRGQEDVEMGGESELGMAFVQPAAERQVDLNEEGMAFVDDSQA